MNRSSMPNQIMAFSNGGLASFIPRQTQIAGQPHMLAYINPQEEALLRDFGGSGIAGPGGIPSYPPESAINADYNTISGSDKYNTVDDKPSGQSATGGSFNQAIEDKANNEAIRGSDPAVIGGYSGSVYGGGILSGLKGTVQNIAQDVMMGLRTFGMGKEKQAEALANAGYTQAQINSYLSRTAQRMKEAAEAGKDYGGEEAGLLLADVVKRDEAKEEGPPTSTNFRFYGGYQPRTREDVLVASPGANQPFVMPNDPRIAPLFASNASLDSQLGIASLMGSQPATAAMYQGIMS